MSWAKLDDQFPDHPKVVGLSDSAFRLHVSAICYAARFLTDGGLPAGVAGRLGGSAALLGELVETGVWVTDGNGYRIHDYLDYNPTREDALAIKAARSEAGKLGAERRWRSDGKPDGKSHSKPEASGKQTGGQIDAPSPSPSPSPSSEEAPHGKPAAPAGPPWHTDELFKRLRAAYPEKARMRQTLLETWTLWCKVPKRDRETVATYVEKRVAGDWDWRKEDGQFAPGIGSFLRKRGWLREWLPTAEPTTARPTKRWACALGCGETATGEQETVNSAVDAHRCVCQVCDVKVRAVDGHECAGKRATA